MLRKTIYATLIVILTTGAASAQTPMQEMKDIQSGQNSWRTEQEKKNDRDIDSAYQSTTKGRPDAEKKATDPWSDLRPAPLAAAKKKQ